MKIKSFLEKISSGLKHKEKEPFFKRKKVPSFLDSFPKLKNYYIALCFKLYLSLRHNRNLLITLKNRHITVLNFTKNHNNYYLVNNIVFSKYSIQEPYFSLSMPYKASDFDSKNLKVLLNDN